MAVPFTRLPFTFVALLFALHVAPSAAAAVTDNVKVPTDIQVFIPCAAGGAGELVRLSGNLHILLRSTVSARGGLHVSAHFQPQGITGVGETTGDKYQGTGVTQEHFNATVGVEETFINNFRIIGAGPGNNYLVHAVVHITFNANGIATAFVDRFSVDCR